MTDEQDLDELEETPEPTATPTQQEELADIVRTGVAIFGTGLVQIAHFRREVDGEERSIKWIDTAGRTMTISIADSLNAGKLRQSIATVFGVVIAAKALDTDQLLAAIFRYCSLVEDTVIVSETDIIHDVLIRYWRTQGRIYNAASEGEATTVKGAIRSWVDTANGSDDIGYAGMTFGGRYYFLGIQFTTFAMGQPGGTGFATRQQVASVLREYGAYYLNMAGVRFWRLPVDFAPTAKA